MSTNETRKPVTAPDAGEVESTYGEFAEEYASVRADAAEAAGNPATPRWEEVEQEIRVEADQAGLISSPFIDY